MSSFLSRTIDFFFFFLSFLWMYLWLAETSQQPISQTTWLKVTPYCNHCNHYKELGRLLESRNLLPKAPSFMFILSITLPNLSIPDVPFPALLSTLIRRRFQVKPANLLIPIDLFLIPLVEEFYGTRYQSGSFSLIN